MRKLVIVVVSEGKFCFCLARKMVVTYVCLRCVVSSLSVVSPLAKF